MIKIGMILGDRYEVLEKIGAGGMSDVYKAKDHKLNRLVAVKVLKQEFSENANFVSRFSTEAQAAACLMHPNIVTVYDVGEENGVYYIVMELIEGITLKKYIEKKARVSVKEAVSIAIQVAMGIEAAHSKHIIHRDIKPQNIIISKDGKVKVTDFGIAKAATSKTISSNVMGSVHYTSPEQARGGYSDEKSDIYSLGITIYEMLTGRVPFDGDTTVAIAIKHIQEDMVSPREYVPEIPISIEKIVMKCCQKSPQRRYQCVPDLIDDLKQSLLNPNKDIVKDIETEAGGSTRMYSEDDMSRIKSAYHEQDYEDYEEEYPPYRESKKKSRRDEIRYVDDYDEEEEDYDPKKEKLTTILMIVAAALVGLLIVLFAGHQMGLFHFGGDSAETETVEDASGITMIDAVGKSLTDAEQALTALGLKTAINYVETSAYDANTVISQDVEKGQKVEKGAIITLTVSTGGKGVEVPNVVEKTYEEAKTELEKAGFVVSKTETTNAAVKENYVIKQSPESSSKAPAGSTVTLTVSTGADDSKIRVPNLVGVTEDEALAKLIEAGLELGKTSYTESNEVAEGQVCWQSVSEGSYLDAGGVVDIRVSSGKSEGSYKFNGNITAPTAQEDPKFKPGTPVQVTITAGDGTVLRNSTETSFPIAVNYSGIKSPNGIVTFNYTNTTDAVTSTNPETGETTVTEGTSTPVSISRKLEFVEE